MPKLSDKPLTLLNGTAVKTEKGFYYIKNGNRIRIPTHRVLESWGFFNVVRATEAAVAGYPVVGKMGFRDGTLIFCIADASHYIISDSKLHKVESPDTIHDHGLSRLDALWVSKAERDLHKRAS